MNKSKLAIRLVTTLSLIIVGSFIFFNWLKKTVVLSIDGESQQLTLVALTVADVLRQKQIPLAEADLLSPALSHWLKEGETISIQRAAQVPILVDGQVHILLTAAREPSNILIQANIAFHPGDRLVANGEPISLNQTLQKDPKTGQLPALQLFRQIQYTVNEGDKVESLLSSATLIGQALWKAGIVINTLDVIEPSLDTALESGLQVSIQRARPVSITSQEQTRSTMVVAATVGEALSKAGFSIQALDYTIPSETEPLPEDGMIRLVRVREEVLVEQTPIPYETQYQPAPDLEIDSQTILQAGEHGLKATRIRIRYEDGQEVARQVEEEWTARQPQNRIIGYGTNLVQHTIDTPDGVISYWRAITMYAVSYSPASAGGSITASGQPLRKGLVAVDTRYIPLGTRLYIPGYGEAMAADTGGGVRGRMIDLGYSNDDYIAWHQNVTVYFLWPPPSNVVWIFP